MIFLLFFFQLVSANEVMTADLFDQEGKEKIFTFESKRVYGKEIMTYEATFKDAKTGEVVASEKAEINKGLIVRYDVQRMPTKESGVIEVKNSQLYFSYNDAGKKSESREPLKENTLISATLVPYLESHMEDLLAKKDVDFRYAVWFRKETVGFRFSFDKEEGTKVVFKMNPTNFLYKSMVKPIYFTYEKSTKKLLTIQGRTLPKHKMGGAWKDFDALAIYK
jgi:hypothetical protein